ncbi:hypothetical protein FRACYDRAFT_250261 [Fragilariopsis cylindrus CCMP1102]|uniref:G-protein coupled receptors family 3 profile domain-containing protein n=1 Tax=Fragilariopsis cylindrus CCMP1102 TaxID=635003 RepID=A0A1E7EQ08_9STRA|nr:hypothetical protein FRACYDRAFT_250261 [Fragilariopsis cylindrus CCMP1102]|eukprot:OEU08039.1 hypothetical protein FRACYDRAFT_250261 [Fragilariopsis cylindrus CCMP1102]
MTTGSIINHDEEDEEIMLPSFQLSVEYVAPWIFLICIILIVAAIICCVGSCAFVFYYQNKPIVAMGQPTFLYNLCFGALLLAIGMAFGVVVIFFSKGENGIIPVDSKTGIILYVCCSFEVWLIYLGYIVIYTVLLCKIYRIMKITQQPLRRGLKILPRHVLWPFILIFSLTVSLLIAWSATGSSKYVVYEDPDTNITIGLCAATPDMASVSPSAEILSALQSLLLIVQLVLCILACKIRKINQVLGDSKKILGLVVFQLIINSICISIAAANGEGTGILVYTINLVINSISTVGFIILPRMYYVWYEHQHGHLPENVVMIGGGTTTVRGVNQDTGNGAGTGVISPPSIVSNNDDNNNSNNNNDNNNDVNICDGGNDNSNNNNIEDDGGVVDIAC